MDLAGAPSDDAQWDRYGASLRDLAKAYNITNPPSVAVVRWVKPEDESRYVNPCVAAKGFEMRGRSFVNIDANKGQNFDHVMFNCMAAYPEMPKYTAVLNDDNLRNVYAWILKSEIPCLEKRGFRIVNVPSETEYVSGYRLQPFFPFAQLPAMSESKSDALEMVCPQWPPSELVYGY